jgi:superfamily II DNA or RNA helicase
MMMPPMTPRPEQEEAIQEVLETKRHLCRGETGAGKTLIGVEAVLRSKAKITLVIAPLNPLVSWHKTFERQSKGKVTPLVIDSTKAGKLAFERLAGRKAGVYLMTWEKFRMYDWSSMPLGFVIADEVHRSQNRNAVTARALWTTRHAEYALALSATPWGNRIEGAWAILKWLWWGDDEVVGKNQGFWNWVTRHLTTELDQYAGKKITGEREQGSVWASVPSRSYFPSPYQVEPIVHMIEVDLTAYQRKVYEKFEADALVWLEDNPLIAEGGGVQRMRLREICLAVPSIREVWKKVPEAELDDPESRWHRFEQEERENGTYALVEEVYFKDDAKSTKADAIIDQLNDLYAGGAYPVIMFTHSRKFALMLTNRLKAKKFRAEHFVGGMSNEERAYRLDGFGTQFDVLVSTIPSIGTGTDGLQLVCWTEFWISLDDNRVLNEQANGRIPRDGQTKTVQRFIFMAKDTVELVQKGKLDADAAQLDGSFKPQTDLRAA